ncbi:hypothetical protein VP01_874g6 [Puccinia sorghi]|uniref:Integrase catalytic domain-containing protein n=1 Tax=Puccinia sorghi TaxID=27349 RepID=A0A0L6U8P3_9BASI|nr:hypothetical protein VP01_874g6 [Puccinia sorghi]
MTEPIPAAAGANDSFRQAMLKTALETIPQLTEENYSIWKDKMTALLKLRGVLRILDNPQIPLGESVDAELVMLLLSKMDSVTHNNVVTADNRDSAQRLWLSIKERFASSQSSNRARMFNDFLYVKFQEDAVESFVTDIKVSIKKLVDVGIELPQDILAYLVLFKFPASLQNLKRQIMHSDKNLDVEFVCNHLIQFNNESKAESSRTATSMSEAVLFSNKSKPNKTQGNEKASGQPTSSKRCKNGYHNPRQDNNHSSENCWHLHPDKAPEWWRESQAQWKAGKEKEKESYFMALMTLWIDSGNLSQRIILDSGASAHIFNDARFFESLEVGNFDVIKTGKQDATLPIKGRGTVQLSWGNRAISLSDCLYVPDIVINLISAGELDSKGCQINSKHGRFKVANEGKLVFGGSVANGLFSVDNPSDVGNSKNALTNLANGERSLKEIHETYGHASIQRIESILKVPFSKSEKENFECKHCILAKMTRKPFKEVSTLATKPFERIHLDLIGPITPESSLKHRFILTVVDNNSGYIAGFPLHHKDDTSDVLIDLLENEHRRRGYYPTTVCSDGGGEFVGNRAERANRSITESMRATHLSSGIPKKFWHEILKTCCLGLNQLPKKGEKQSPWEKLHQKSFPPDLLKAVGTPAIVLNQTRVKGRKFDAKGEEGKLLGVNVSLRSYRVLLPSGRILESKHVHFLKKPEEGNNMTLDLDEAIDFPDQSTRAHESPGPQVDSAADLSGTSDHGENNPNQEDPSDENEDEIEVS